MSRRLMPNSTQIPDLIIDEWMPRLSGAEIKTVLFIARKTFGWGKAEESMSATYIAEGCGISRRAAIDACSSLEAKQALICTPSELPKGHPKAWNTYSLNMDWTGELPDEDQEASAEIALDTRAEIALVDAPFEQPDPCRNCTGSSAEIARVQGSNQCKNCTQQETRNTIQETAAEQTAATAAIEAEVLPEKPASVVPEMPGQLGQSVSLLSMAEADLDTLAKAKPSALVRQFQREHPDYRPKWEMKEKTAERSPYVLLAQCIVTDWLPEIREKHLVSSLPGTVLAALVAKAVSPATNSRLAAFYATRQNDAQEAHQ